MPFELAGHPPAWEADLAEAAAVLADLDEDRVVADARAAAVDWKAVEHFSSFFLPLPIIAQAIPSLEGTWAAEERESHETYDLVGFDARGRPVIHLLDAGREFERAKHLWFWDDDGSFLEIELMGSGPHVRRARVADGRLAHVATASDERSTSVRRLEWRDGLPVRAWEAFRWDDDYGGLDRAIVARVRDGQVHQLWSGYRDASGDIAAGLRRAVEIEPDRLDWDGRVRRPEPWPGAAAARAFVEPLAQALDRALREAAAEAGIEAPFLLAVQQGERDDTGYHSLPPFALLAGTQWRDRMRAASAHHGAAIHTLGRGVESGQVAELRLVDRLDDEALHACRVFTSALRTGASWSTHRSAAPVANAVGDRLAALLNAAPLAGAADPFVALVHVGDPYREDGELALSRARAAVGEARFAAFLASVGSTAPRPEPVDDDDGGLDELALVDRDALEALLAATPLAAHAKRLAHEVAAEALHLDPADAAGSRLGGPPLLPAGATWPESDDGGTLTFLAAIDLSELPPSTVTSALPPSGWLLFFAEMYTEESEGLMDEADNAPGSVARVFFAEEVVPAEPPEELETVLEHRPVAARRVLTLPDDYEAAERLGFDVYEGEAYEEIVERVRPDEEADHWIGGHITGAQGHPPPDDTLLLLHLGWDEDLGFCFQDGGAVQFRIPTRALAARDWSQVLVEADSG